jgi:DNA-directed RNA polymerase specialized sigma24 family protein
MDSSGKALLPYDSRAAVAQDPPSSGRLPVVEDLAATTKHAGLQRGISPEELRALLANPRTQESIRSVVASRLAGGADSPLMDDLVQEANLLMLASPLGPRSMATASGWVSTIAWRAVADYFRRAGSEDRWMARDDEADLAALPGNDEPYQEKVLLSDWLARAVAGNAKDAETLEILLRKARLNATYDQVAAEHGLTSNALRCRVNAFKTKYEAEWRKHRAMLVLLLLLSAIAVAVAAWVWIRSTRNSEQVDPVPSVPTAPLAPTAHPSATASAQDTPFEPAAPPTAAPPSPIAPPQQAPAPAPAPAPKRPDKPPQRYNQFGKPI